MFRIGQMAIFGIAGCAATAAMASEKDIRSAESRPNILFCVVDDVSYGHFGCYGCDWVRTPACDSVASAGVRFTRAFTPNAKSGPSRSCILTGLTSWQLGPAANHFACFPSYVRTFPEILAENGYETGMTGKGWFPGEPGEKDGKPRLLIGKKYNGIKCVPPYPTISNIDYAANFSRFLDRRDKDKPFFFWYGGWEAHRPYTQGSGLSDGRTARSIDGVPKIYPDCPTVREDMCDYAYEIEYFDTHLSRMLSELERRGLLENTLVIITSDNGMSFPRIKGQCYFDSHHLPLIMMWQGHIAPGQVSDAFVSFTDLAPTVMDAAGADLTGSGMQQTEGSSLLGMLGDEKSWTRDFVCIGKERHDIGRPGDAGYPVRGIVTDRWLYLRNWHPERDPAGNPDTGYLNYGASPTKTLLLSGKGRYFDMSFGKRPEEELYDIRKDPDCVRNLAQVRKYSALRDSLRILLETQLKKDGDPRMSGDGDRFDDYPYSNAAYRNYYDRLMAGDSIPLPNWIIPSDVDWKRLDSLRQTGAGNREMKWFKGNTHMHSVRSDGDSPLETMINWYDDHDYDFVVLTDHNISLDTSYVDMRQVGDILVIPGNELTYKSAHCTAIGLEDQIVASRFFHDGPYSAVKGYQREIDAINAAGALPIINHPNFGDGVQEDELLEIEGYGHMELFNGHPLVYNFGKEGHAPVEEKWDYILSHGKKVYGVAADDSHRLKTKKAYPGKGWIMVQAPELSEAAVTDAIRQGRFYASTGVFLDKCIMSDGSIEVGIDTVATKETVARGLGAFYLSDEGKPGFRIEVVSDGGEVIRSVEDTSLKYGFVDIDKYVRVRLTYTVMEEDGYRVYFAWTQPLFEDE